MAESGYAPKQWVLTKHETRQSYEAWKNNLLSRLSLTKNNKPFLKKGVTWSADLPDVQHRGFEDDAEPVPEAARISAEDKSDNLERMLGQIANYCPVISRNSIVKSSTCLNDIWAKIREHYGIQLTGTHFLGLTELKQEPDESVEDLFQKITAFMEDNLLQAGSKITHHNKAVAKDEVMTPTLENVIVALWLQTIHPGLPNLIRQKYSTTLRSQTIASIKSEISAAIPGLLDDLKVIDRVNCYHASQEEQAHDEAAAYRAAPPGAAPYQFRKNKSCALCKEAKRRYNNHSIWECRYLPDNERRDRRFTRSRHVDNPDPYHFHPHDKFDDEDIPYGLLDHTSINCRAVDTEQSPFFNAYYNDHCVRVTLDSGATSSLVRESFVRRVGMSVKPNFQRARLADGISMLNVKGEVHAVLTRGGYTFKLDALVVDKLDVDMLVGMPFLSKNDICIRFAKQQIVIQGREIIKWDQTSCIEPSVRRSRTIRAPQQSILLPGDFIDLPTPKDVAPDGTWALEPRLDAPSNAEADVNKAWPIPQVVQSVDNSIRVVNTSDDIITLKKHEHICQIHDINDAVEVSATADSTMLQFTKPKSTRPFSATIQVDPGHQLTQAQINQVNKIHKTYDDVFNPEISKYNGASGNIEAVVNMGPTLPPQRKGRLPQYNKSKTSELQAKFDELETAGVFARPEDVGVSVEYLNISFLVTKPSGGTRLVTSFGEVASYSKPQPSLMPNVDKVLREVAQWRFIIMTDLHHAFYQIPLASTSMKFCGVATPYKGIRVYTRCAMGMPGSETCLEELMSRVLGHLVEEGCVTKLADDLYCGGSTVEEALHNWSRVLAALSSNNLRLSASKTIVCPTSATILGWIWSQGRLSASPHKVSALSTVQPPSTVQGLRSFVGAYKVLSRVLNGYAALLHPLEVATAGKSSREYITWTDELSSAFKQAQSALKACKTITLPQPQDILWIVTDGSVKNCGISATLYLRRKDQMLLGGFFNMKLKSNQVTWLPCEIEALCISAAVHHFAPYLAQSHHQGQVLTDSRPCVQAYNKLLRGEFSNSARVTTFLSVVSRYQLHVRHIAGAVNLPTDYTSRNPSVCPDATCQVCKFVHELQTSVVRSVYDVLNGTATMPFTNRTTWLATQQECPDMRRACAHLTQGTRPSKKATTIRDVKRYLNVLRVAHDGLLVVKDDRPFHATKDRIAVPRSVLDGLVTALHIQFNHPTPYQNKQLFSRQFFALDSDQAVDRVCGACHHCTSLLTMPHQPRPQTSEPPPDRVGVSYAADVMKRYKQLVLVLRETVTSFTATMCLASERHGDLREGIIMLVSQLQPPSESNVFIRVDSAPGLAALKDDPMLAQQRITLVYGRIKNLNKNPVAERAIQELGNECLRIEPRGGPLSQSSLALATSHMNMRIRSNGLSAKEMWTQRDQITGEQLPIDDRQHILDQHLARLKNHSASSQSKSRGRPAMSTHTFHVGDLVYLKHEKSKEQARDKYMIVAINGQQCSLRKFTNSQFRARIYDVPISDCYPITATIPRAPCQAPYESSSSDGPGSYDSDVEDDVVHPGRPPEAPHAIDQPPEPALGPARHNAGHHGRPPDVPEEMAQPAFVPNQQTAGHHGRPPDVPEEIAQPLDNDPGNILPQDNHHGAPEVESEVDSPHESPIQRRKSTRRRVPNKLYDRDTWDLSD